MQFRAPVRVKCVKLVYDIPHGKCRLGSSVEVAVGRIRINGDQYCIFGFIGREESNEGSLELFPAVGVALRVFAAASLFRRKDHAGGAGLSCDGHLGAAEAGGGTFVNNCA